MLLRFQDNSLCLYNNLIKPCLLLRSAVFRGVLLLYIFGRRKYLETLLVTIHTGFVHFIELFWYSAYVVVE